MAERLGKIKTNVGLPSDMVEEIKVLAVKLGIGWTSAVPVLLREALDARKGRAS